MKRFSIGWLALCLIMVMGCQKEVSFEVGNKPSDGSLLSETSGDCLPKTVNGTYVAAEPLVPATNTITVSVIVKQTGVYTVYTDTVNGYFFRTTGVFVTLGTNTVTLRSNGTPFSAGINNFVVNYDSTTCDIAVTVLPVGSKPAVYTLETTAGNCSGAIVGGSYATTNSLNFTNTVTLRVNVISIGTYDIKTDKNGMTFSKKGSFTMTGVQTVTLEGTGTPTVNGDNIVPINVGTTTCSFTVPVGNPAQGTLGGASGACTGSSVNGTYTVGTLLDGTNSVQLQVNLTAGGIYSIATDTVDGISFAASGVFTVTSPPSLQSVTLNAKGTPTKSGIKTFTVKFGSSTCTFTVNVVTATPVFDWEFTEGTTTYKGTTTTAQLTSIIAPTLSLIYLGSNAATDALAFSLVDVSGTINNAETYSTLIVPIPPTNASVFNFTLNGGTDVFTTDATRNLTFNVTTHTPATKKIIGTFAGQVKNNAGATKIITGGTFTVVY